MFVLFRASRFGRLCPLGIAGALASLIGWGANPASAQTAPAPQTSPAATDAATQTGGRGGNAPTTAITTSHAKFGHLFIIDIVPIISDPQFYTPGPLQTSGQPSVNPLKNAGVGYDPLDVGGTVKLPITPIFSASFDRLVEGTFNAPSARVTTAATSTGAQSYQYNAYSRDSVLVYRLDEQIKRLQIEEGLYFRHRIVGGANTSNNPLLPTISSTEGHFGYAGLTYVTGGIPWLLKSFVTLNISADVQSVDHHVACLLKTFDGVKANCPKGNTTGVIDENPAQSRVWESDQYVQLTIPVDAKHGVSLSGQDRWGALNFYENAPFPYRYTTSQTYLLTKRFNQVVALSLRARDQWAVPLGYPYVKPNAQHNGTIDVLADFKLDANSLIH